MVVMLTTALMINTVKVTSGLSEAVYQKVRNVLVVSAVLVFGIGFLPLSSLITLSLIVLLLVLPIVAALRVFLRQPDAAEVE